MFTTRFTARATRVMQTSNLCAKTTTFAQQRRSIHDIKLPHHENHIAASEYTRHLQHLLTIKESEIKEKDTIISTLRAQKILSLQTQQNQQNQQNQTTTSQTRQNDNNEEKIQGTIWTGGMTDTDGFGAGWRGKGWDKPVKRKEGRMRELMRGMTGEERERYDHL